MSSSIAFYGNIANNLYQIAKALRRTAGLDAHLFVDRGANVHQAPESDDPELAGNYPDWIHLGDWAGPGTTALPFLSPLPRELDRFDVVVVSALGPMFAQFCKRPVYFFPTGGDLTRTPFPLRHRAPGQSLRRAAEALACGFWQRRGIRACREIWVPAFAPYVRSLERMGVADRRARSYLPLILDTDKFSPEAAAAAAAALPSALRAPLGDRFTVLHPSRLMMREDAGLREIGQWKNNGVLIEGFARFVRETGADAVLALFERTHSPDRDLARAMIADLGIGERVAWLAAPSPEGFTRAEMLGLYGAAHVVADDFGMGWGAFGSVAMEALATGRPLLARVDEAPTRAVYPDHPVLGAETPGDVAAHLARLYADPARRAELGARGAAWVREHHAYAPAAARYAREFARIMPRPGR